MTNDELRDAVESMRGERDSARQHTEEALDSAQKSRAEVRELRAQVREAFACGGAVLGGLMAMAEAIRTNALRRRFLRTAQDAILGKYGTTFARLAGKDEE